MDDYLCYGQWLNDFATLLVLDRKVQKYNMVLEDIANSSIFVFMKKIPTYTMY